MYMFCIMKKYMYMFCIVTGGQTERQKKNVKETDLLDFSLLYFISSGSTYTCIKRGIDRERQRKTENVLFLFISSSVSTYIMY